MIGQHLFYNGSLYEVFTYLSGTMPWSHEVQKQCMAKNLIDSFIHISEPPGLAVLLLLGTHN